MTWSREVFAKNLQKYIDRKGISQKDLAAIVGVSAPTLNEWIKGKKFPRIDKIEILADYFGIMKSDLIEEKTIDNSPVDIANLHFEIVSDKDFVELYQDFKVLKAEQKQLVKTLVHNLAQTKKEA